VTSQIGREVSAEVARNGCGIEEDSRGAGANRDATPVNAPLGLILYG
jgi:hypothetical protein